MSDKHAVASGEEQAEHRDASETLRNPADGRVQRTPLWQKTQSGLLIPFGMATDFSESSTQTYLQIKEAAKNIEKVYSNCGIPLPENCDLGRLIGEAKALSDSWLGNRQPSNVKDLLASAAFLNRVADAINSLETVKNRSHYLGALMSGSLAIHQRQPSHAKDILWEIEVWLILRSRGFAADLQEPPDIVIRFEDAKIGIACKKLYSEKNVGKVLSEAVSQIEAGFNVGIAALNLDDLVPPSQILIANTEDEMGEFMNNLNVRFLQQHKRHLQRYLTPGRLISVLVSTSVLADVRSKRVRFNIARQSTVWTIPGLPPEKAKQLERFYAQLMH